MIKSYQMFLESKVFRAYNGATTFKGFGPGGICTKKDRREVDSICKEYDIKNWTINNGLVDVNGDVSLDNMGLIKIPLSFGKVSGDFSCTSNKLISLEGSPKEVGGSFLCSGNNLITLEGGPKEVDGNFWCNSNKLINLKFAPRVGAGFWCYNNKLISLEGLIVVNKDLNFINAQQNTISNLSIIGSTMLKNKISFPEAVSIHIKEIPDNELVLIMGTIDPQKILDLNDFRVFNLLRTELPEKYKEVCTLRDVDLSADLGELGF